MSERSLVRGTAEQGAEAGGHRLNHVHVKERTGGVERLSRAYRHTAFLKCGLNPAAAPGDEMLGLPRCRRGRRFEGGGIRDHTTCFWSGNREPGQYIATVCAAV